MLDTDGSGTIDKNEIKSLLKKDPNFSTYTEEYFDNIIKEAD
jgi:hypothetical protein